jgi:hypothetical protein
LLLAPSDLHHSRRIQVADLILEASGIADFALVCDLPDPSGLRAIRKLSVVPEKSAFQQLQTAVDEVSQNRISGTTTERLV